MYDDCMKTVEVEAMSILTPQKSGALHGSYQYSLNPYAGCAFSCSYCYVPKFPTKRPYDFTEWGKWLEVKINAPELVRKERACVFGSSIFFSSATDPYQYAELKYRLSRKCLKELLKYKPAKLTLHTRSHLILQDLDILKEFGDVLTVGVSITTDNEIIRKQFEPGAPSIGRRMEVIERLSEEGIKVFASLAPLLPCDSDRLIAMLEPRVESIWISEMNYPEVNTRPHLLETHKQFFEPDNYLKVQRSILSKFKEKKKNRNSLKLIKNHEDKRKLPAESKQLSLLPDRL